MITSSEMELRILSELEEIRFNSITSLLNTVAVSGGDGENLIAFRDACLSLLLDGYIYFTINKDRQGKFVAEELGSSIEKIKEIVGNLMFDSEGHLWIMSKKVSLELKPRSFPHLVLTNLGLEKSIEVLEERGSRWWC
jgi:hypothetical protein